ncbi:hypothetical protein Dthio_PD2988 [Desulfonatronospira thiodismutans ASO3-1]|uniref:Uncharacterized protein n=1 Tax=Desulfonatronospira thiodismutans ASO3-1 TaxID=555779 RepID=D6SLK1_9BACT|nr:hypothetical protein [Desulfonatronospira thiodismutans]EFI35562.1 hypothetical protein Dthio_PD2988 [Desulfonatronospira thiodismutans ASO3-1]
MTTKGLLSLREIANELKINYNTLISCKNYFEENLQVRNIGRTPKYQAEYADFFRLVFALKDEGYVMPQIVEIIQENQRDKFEPSLAEWVAKWHYELFNERMNEPVIERTDDLTNELMIEPTNELTNEPTNERTDDLMNERTNECTEPDWEVIVSEATSRMENKLSDHRTQLNSTITKLYQVTTELQQAAADLNRRISRLENELNGEAGSEPKLTELDLEELQIQQDNPPAPTRYEHASLEFVKASIQNGKPDRDAVIQWILSEKERDPQVSYGHLAKVLDEAQVPTLSGKTGWCRTTLRNIMVKHKV